MGSEDLQFPDPNAAPSLRDIAEESRAEVARNQARKLKDMPKSTQRVLLNIADYATLNLRELRLVEDFYAEKTKPTDKELRALEKIRQEIIQKS
ncbi:MAG: hypothetical protein COY80_02460 [Candidatus Pacebacteria bacterium CG_4_10_14_0_8_um_filter_42_14]|nr:MAG: hypothetical protein COY80_02460 [Candidatus Pacebacteria bacterium CG_4_10_14_0_8_um_filter_42_14]